MSCVLSVTDAAFTGRLKRPVDRSGEPGVMLDEDDDPVVQEVDVFLSKQLSENLYLLQYPVRPVHMGYDDAEHLAARIKPKQQKVRTSLPKLGLGLHRWSFQAFVGKERKKHTTPHTHTHIFLYIHIPVHTEKVRNLLDEWPVLLPRSTESWERF